MATLAFASLKLNPDLLSNLATLGYNSMTPVQAQSLPQVLAGNDLIVRAKTGSGKTAAFALGALQCLDVARIEVQVLVLCPTRELSDQVSREIRQLGRSIDNIKLLTLCGGTPLRPQRESLIRGAHIVVGTPGRIEDHIRKGHLTFAAIKLVVLDEADRMLDMGFQPTIDLIVDSVTVEHQTLLFSATYPDAIEQLATRVMQTPVSVDVDVAHNEDSISEVFYLVEQESERIDVLEKVLLHYQLDTALVFCTTKRQTEEIAESLRKRGFSALSINGDLEQRDRDSRLVRFTNKSLCVLVATDVAARGLDIDELELVVNFHVARDLDGHTHRIGRTGRAGKSGVACTLVHEKERNKLKQLSESLGRTLKISEAPLTSDTIIPLKPAMVTLELSGGRKNKIRPGDVLGALTASKKLAGSDVGNIKVTDNATFIAVRRELGNEALDILGNEKVKGRRFRIRKI
jgi:ATP-independent RNA helicase DbpA